jgi:hypothetical protein
MVSWSGGLSITLPTYVCYVQTNIYYNVKTDTKLCICGKNHCSKTQEEFLSRAELLKMSVRVNFFHELRFVAIPFLLLVELRTNHIPTSEREWIHSLSALSSLMTSWEKTKIYFSKSIPPLSLSFHCFSPINETHLPCCD